jgi:hypothetical protein
MKKILFIMACCLALLASCNKEEESAFSGRDNYITSFQLAIDDSRFTAAIENGQITIQTVEGRDLDGATASVALSENAKIFPDPAGISDWNNNRTFVVTSYSGEQQIYQYTVIKEKAEAVKKGHFVFTTQTEVDDFGTLGVEVLDGSLTLGAPFVFFDETVPEDPIISLAPLSALKEIKGTLTLEYTIPDDLASLKNLKQTGTIFVNHFVTSIKDFIFPALETVHGNIWLDGVTGPGRLVRIVYLPKLKLIEGDFRVEGLVNIYSFMVPSLESILGELYINGNAGTPNLEVLSFPQLEFIGGSTQIWGLYSGSEPKVEFPVLKRCGGIAWGDLASEQETIAFPMLEQLMGTTTFGSRGATYVTTARISFPNLTYAEDLTFVELGSLVKLDMPKLARVKNLKLENMATITSLEDALGALETVDGTLTLINLSGLTGGFALPASLTSLNTLAVSRIPGLNELDLRGTGIKGVSVDAPATTPFKLTADDVLEGSLTLSGPVTLAGFKETKGNVTLTVTATEAANEQIPNTQKIGGNLSLSYTGKKGSVSTPALQEVGGSVTIKSDSPFKADNLTTIGGAFLYDITMSSLSASIVSEFALPKLTSVGGDFTIYPWARPTTVLLDIRMPALTRISGKLLIRHTDPGSAYGSTTLPSNNVTNLDGFSALTSVQSVEIFRQGGLKSFKGLKSAIKSFSAANWDVKNCGYNPTYEDMVNGNTEGI